MLEVLTQTRAGWKNFAAGNRLATLAHVRITGFTFCANYFVVLGIQHSLDTISTHNSNWPSLHRSDVCTCDGKETSHGRCFFSFFAAACKSWLVKLHWSFTSSSKNKMKLHDTVLSPQVDLISLGQNANIYFLNNVFETLQWNTSLEFWNASRFSSPHYTLLQGRLWSAEGAVYILNNTIGPPKNQ